MYHLNYVRFGSDKPNCARHVGFTPESEIRTLGCR
jgi:hypothetical protein